MEHKKIWSSYSGSRSRENKALECSGSGLQFPRLKIKLLVFFWKGRGRSIEKVRILDFTQAIDTKMRTFYPKLRFSNILLYMLGRYRRRLQKE